MRTAATTLCDWLSGRRRCAVSRPVRVELDGSVNSDVDDGIGGRGATSPKFLRLAVFRTTGSPEGRGPVSAEENVDGGRVQMGRHGFAVIEGDEVDVLAEPVLAGALPGSRSK